jgi:hypothetical protein
MDRAGIRLGDEDDDVEGRPQMTDELGQPVDEEQLSAFRDFIDSLDLDDFGKPRSG